MKTNTITISEVKNLLQKLELKLTSQMDREIKFRVKEEVRYIEQKNKEIEGMILNEDDEILP